MICAKCKQRLSPGAGTLEKIRRGEIRYTHRICPSRLKPAKTRKYQLKKPRKLGWAAKREPALTTKCEITLSPFVSIKHKGALLFVDRVVDHLVPERLAVETGKDPHDRINLICIKAVVHARKRAAEDALLKFGDILSYLQELARQSWPMDRVHAALKFYGIRHGDCITCREVVTPSTTQESKLHVIKSEPRSP